MGESRCTCAGDEPLAQASARHCHNYDLGRTARRHFRGTGLVAARRLRARVGAGYDLRAGSFFHSGSGIDHQTDRDVVYALSTLFIGSSRPFSGRTRVTVTSSMRSRISSSMPMTEPLPASLPAAPLALPYMMFRGRLKSRDFTNTQRSRRTRTVHGDFCSGLLQHRKISAGGQVRNVASAFILTVLEDRPQAETADLLGISLKAVETRAYRARKLLLEKMSKMGF